MDDSEAYSHNTFFSRSACKITGTPTLKDQFSSHGVAIISGSCVDCQV
jgi:hypothetical protein